MFRVLGIHTYLWVMPAKRGFDIFVCIISYLNSSLKYNLPNILNIRFLILPDEAMEDGDSPPNANGSARPFQSKKEKSTAILLAIILIFVACHLLRFIVQIYEVFSGPLHGSHKLYQVSTTYLTLLGLGLIKINTVLANFNNLINIT